ncbi:MAG: SpoIVB peptidase [Ruminococcus sp.]|nr:SpoIVB peptidase [Ruminococcus sp.]MCM1381848.1 SpoIVB peptidase [Muribaculaceae bacterium]
MKNFIKLMAIMTNLLLLTCLGIIVYFSKSLPNNYYVAQGGELKISNFIEAVPCGGAYSGEPYAAAGKTETKRVELKLLGIIPIKTVNIQEVDEPVLIPCGNPFGIKMLTDGVIVVEAGSFDTVSGIKSPAADAGIKAGDIIKSINGEKVSSNEDIADIVEKSGGERLTVNIVRDGANLVINASPMKSKSDGAYRIGLWVRDSSAGIGTVTFYNPETGVFAGLGHPVCDIDTGKIMPLSSGEVVDVNVNGIKRGLSGIPGELIGGFTSNSPVGTLEMNCENGLYGILFDFTPSCEALPLGMRQEIETGEAYIYTTVSGSVPQKYKIVIEKIDLQDSRDSRNMIIRVTDEALLDKTGGIVQGMSGSPIIQNGKLVGAVTHVFVNNPTKGYAIFADTMYDCSQSVLSEDAAA